jgi:hypothetical protein
MAKTLIKTLTASGDSELDFVDGTDDVVMDNTYDVYEFHFVNMRGDTDREEFCFQVDVDGSTSYDQPITSTFLRTYHYESDGGNSFSYYTYLDQVPADAVPQKLSMTPDYTETESSVSGKLTLYAPSSTTYQKHFTAESVCRGDAGGEAFYAAHAVSAGYISTTTAIDKIEFTCDNGNIDAGVIKMFGVS